MKLFSQLTMMAGSVVCVIGCGGHVPGAAQEKPVKPPTASISTSDVIRSGSTIEESRQPLVASAEKKVMLPVERSRNSGLQGEVRSRPKVQGKITEIDLEHLFLLKGEDRVLMVDVRPKIFFAMGHIEGAISLPLKSYGSAYAKKKALLDQAVQNDQVIVIYCADLDCPDGYAVARKLSNEGYATSLYKGGWAEWKAAGLE